MDDESHGAAGLPPAAHAGYADQNLESMHAHLRDFEGSLMRGVCSVRSLVKAYRDNYGVLINAKDAGLDQLAHASAVADQALEDLIVFCRAAAARSMGSATVAAAECAGEYARLRDVIVYGEQ